MNGVGKIVAIILGAVSIIATIFGLLWFIGTLAFAPIALAGELEKLKTIVEIQAETADKRAEATDRLTESVSDLVKKMSAREAVEADREKMRRRPARFPREGKEW